MILMMIVGWVGQASLLPSQIPIILVSTQNPNPRQFLNTDQLTIKRYQQIYCELNSIGVYRIWGKNISIVKTYVKMKSGKVHLLYIFILIKVGLRNIMHIMEGHCIKRNIMHIMEILWEINAHHGSTLAVWAACTATLNPFKCFSSNNKNVFSSNNKNVFSSTNKNQMKNHGWIEEKIGRVKFHPGLALRLRREVPVV